MKCKEQEGDCDQNGDYRDGWQNCSACGETDWDSLFKKNFGDTELMNLITQSADVMGALSDIEAEHLDRTSSELQLVDEDGWKKSDLLTANLVSSINRTQKMELFITVHDNIFDTDWRNVYKVWRLERATKHYRKLRLEEAIQGGI